MDFDLRQTGEQVQKILDSVANKADKSEVEQLRELYEALTQTEPDIIQPSDTWPVANPEEGVIYRVIDRENTPPQYYSDYMWNGTSMVEMAQYNNGTADIPIVNSPNVMTAGGVANHGSAFDISEYNKSNSTLATYADLAAALAAVPSSVQKGGMSIKFVSSVDNKYVQYRYMLTDVSTAATFTNVNNWQKWVSDKEVQNLQYKTKDISADMIADEEDAIVFEDNSGNKVGVIDSTGASFVNVKSGGKNVLTKIKGLDEETIYEGGETIEVTTDDGETIVEITSEGIKAKEFILKNGEKVSNELDLCIKDKISPSYFVEEQNKTIETLDALKDASSQCCVYAIMSDIHVMPEGGNGAAGRLTIWDNTILNAKKVAKKSAINGIIGLGDYLGADRPYWFNFEIVNKELDYFQRKFMEFSDDVFMLIGNHDGIGGSVPITDGNFSMLNRSICTRGYNSENKPRPYFYFDNSTIKTRFLCLGVPFKDADNPYTAWNVDARQIQFVIDSLESLSNDWHVIVLCHVHPYTTSIYGNSGMNTVVSILAAFGEHSTYSDGTYTADFSNFTTTKLVAWVCGHQHYDAVYSENAYSNGTGWVENELGCPIIVQARTGYSGTAEDIKTSGGVNYGVVPARSTNNVKQDCWDFLVYQRDLGKITMVRFGSSPSTGVGCTLTEDGDREINV